MSSCLFVLPLFFPKTSFLAVIALPLFFGGNVFKTKWTKINYEKASFRWIGCMQTHADVAPTFSHAWVRRHTATLLGHSPATCKMSSGLTFKGETRGAKLTWSSLKKRPPSVHLACVRLRHVFVRDTSQAQLTRVHCTVLHVGSLQSVSQFQLFSLELLFYQACFTHSGEILSLSLHLGSFWVYSRLHHRNAPFKSEFQLGKLEELTPSLQFPLYNFWVKAVHYIVY